MYPFLISIYEFHHDSIGYKNWEYFVSVRKSMNRLSCNQLVMFLIYYNWAMTCDFQQCGILTSVDSDKTVQPPFKLRNLKWGSVSSLTVIEYLSDQQRLWSVCEGWSEPLLVAHTTLLEISCHGSYVIWALPWENLILLYTNNRHRPVRESTQSGQGLCYLLSRKYKSLTS